MSMLAQFEQSYSSLTADITSKIGRLSMVASVARPSLSAGKRPSLVTKISKLLEGIIPAKVIGRFEGERSELVGGIERLMTEVEDVLDQMELGIRELPSTDRPKYDIRLKSYRADKASLGKELSAALARLEREESRDQLFSSPSSSNRLSQEHRTSLLNNTETLERCTRKLDEGRRIAIETEEIGAGVLSDLSEQRSTLNRARDRLRDAEEEIGDSSRVLNTMIRRVIQNRFLMMGVGVLTFVFIVVAIWVSL